MNRGCSSNPANILACQGPCWGQPEAPAPATPAPARASVQSVTFTELVWSLKACVRARGFEKFGYRIYYSTEFSSTGLFWGMRNIPDLKLYLVKTAVCVTKKFNLLIPWVPVWSGSGCSACVCILKPAEGTEDSSSLLPADVSFLRWCKMPLAGPCLLPTPCIPRYPLLEGRPCGWSCVQDTGCKVGGAVCSGRNVHAHMGRGAKQALGTSAPLRCPGSTPELGTHLHTAALG